MKNGKTKLALAALLGTGLLFLVNENIFDNKSSERKAVICAEFNIDAALPKFSGHPKNLNLRETPETIGLRTQSIQVLRDTYFRACEGLKNGTIGKDEYTTILKKLDQKTRELQ